MFCFEAVRSVEGPGHRQPGRRSHQPDAIRHPATATSTPTFRWRRAYDAKIVLYGDRDKIKLPKKFLIDPANRLIVRTADGKEAVNEALCGNCTDIFDNKVSVVLAARHRTSVPRQRHDRDRRSSSATRRTAASSSTARACARRSTGPLTVKPSSPSNIADQKCTPPEGGCFITTATCEVLGLDDDCFELAALRRYRDHVLAKRPGGQADIARYYELAPLILARLPKSTRRARLLPLYARFILPAALAAHLGFNALAYRLYRRMVDGLAREFAPEILS